MATSTRAAQPWYAAYPSPKSTPERIPRETLLADLNNGAVAGKDFLLVDLRRNDHEGATIRGSLNLPAQSLHASIPVLHQLVRSASIDRVLWYCGSSAGRGTRAAAWFADYIDEQGDTQTKSIVLDGGLAAWIQGGEAFTSHMSEYSASQ